MTGSGYSVLQTIESNAIGAAVGAIVGGTVSGLYKRAVRLEARRIEQLLLHLDHVLGGTAGETTTTQNRLPTMLPTIKQFRKGIAAGAGVIVIGALTWLESANLEPIIGPLVPEPFRPLVGVVLGGIALTASVIIAPNAKKPASSTVGATGAAAAALAAIPTASAAARPSALLASLVSDVETSRVAVPAETSIVPLLPVPVRSYQ